MKVTLNIEKRYAYTIIGLLILVVGIVAINAYGTSSPEIFGHSGDEINVILNGQTVKLNAALSSIDSKIVPSQTTYISGMHCGIHVSGLPIPNDGSGLTSENRIVNCQGLDPAVSCPTGFVKAGGDFQEGGDDYPNRFFYTCVKN
jgi:hypothetical protein